MLRLVLGCSRDARRKHGKRKRDEAFVKSLRASLELLKVDLRIRTDFWLLRTRIYLKSGCAGTRVYLHRTDFWQLRIRIWLLRADL